MMSQYQTHLLDLPIENIVDILTYLSLAELVRMELVCKDFLQIVRKCGWPHFTVKLKNMPVLNYVIRNYHFVDYDFSESKITDEGLRHLGHCRTINLSNCNYITDEGLKYLENCRKINLCKDWRSWNLLRNDISGRELVYQQRKTIVRNNRGYVTNEGLKHLVKCKEIITGNTHSINR